MSILSRRWLVNLVSYTGWEGLVLILTGLAGVLLGLLDFTGRIDLEPEAVASLTLVAAGMLLAAIAAQNSRRAAELAELRQALAVVEVRSLHMKHEFPRELAQRVTRARSFVLDTNLNADVPRFSGISPQGEYERILAERVRAGHIAFRQVVCIFTREHFLEVLQKLVAFAGTDYYIRHFDSPPRAIPILHMMSFDDEHFFLGGFHSAESSTQENAVYVRHPKVDELLREYWRVLWEKAKPLSYGQEIDWQELRRVALRLGFSEEDGDAVLEKAKSQVDSALKPA